MVVPDMNADDGHSGYRPGYSGGGTVRGGVCMESSQVAAPSRGAAGEPKFPPEDSAMSGNNYRVVCHRPV